MTKEQAQALVDKHGSIDVAAPHSGLSVKKFRAFCKENGVSFSRVSKPTASVGDAVSREEILEQEVADLRRQVKAARKSEVFDAKALSLLERNVVSLAADYQPVKQAANKALTPHTWVLQWSDLHAAEVVSYESMSGLNEFNWEIMLQRHQTLARALRSFQKNRPYPIEELVILANGDMVTGDIHDELRETNEENIAEATIRLGYDSAEWIARELAPLFKRIRIFGVVGNHGRISKKPEFKNASKNWDWILYKFLEVRLAEFDHITVEVPSAFEQLVQVYDKNLLVWHGDGVPTNMPGVPWGGITRRTKELFDTWMAKDVYVHHFAVGHYHEANVVGQKRILMNGSIKGPDEYSLKRFGGGRPACQLLHTFHPTRGLVGTDFITL